MLHLQRSQAKKIPLIELFGPTVQGEGSVIGQQTYFLRFGLCDYKCLMCDSMHAVDPRLVKANAKYLTQEEIFKAFTSFHKHCSTRWVTLSGGNPCIHDLDFLVALLQDDGYRVHVETQGTFCPDWLHRVDSLCVSPKTPGMGEKLEFDKLDAFTYKMRGHENFSFKIVVFDQRDIECASMIYERYVLTGQFSPDQFYLSLGNPHPPGTDVVVNEDGKVKKLSDILVRRYLDLLPDIMQDPNLCHTKFLPQFHVLLWDNLQGV